MADIAHLWLWTRDAAPPAYELTIAIATVRAAKDFLSNLEERGVRELRDPTMAPTIDAVTFAAADEFYGLAFADQRESTEAFRLPSHTDYLRVVRHETRFQWTRRDRRGANASPVLPLSAELYATCCDDALVLSRTMGAVVRERSGFRVPRPDLDRGLTHAMAMIALAKVTLARCGDRLLASVAEQSADRDLDNVSFRDPLTSSGPLQ
jgi:hypothetical protein